MLTHLCKGCVLENTHEILHPYVRITGIRFIGYDLSPVGHPCNI